MLPRVRTLRVRRPALRVPRPALRVPRVHVPRVSVPRVHVPRVHVPRVARPPRVPWPPAPRRPAPPGATAGDGDFERAARVYRAAAVAVKPALRLWFGVQVRGREHVPAHGPVILAANHRSNADPPLVALVTDRPVFFMAKAGLFRGPGVALRWIGSFPVRRGGTDRRALAAAQQVVAAGGVLGLFPEGTRGAGTFATVHPGLAYILLRTGCPVVPVAVLGTERLRRRFGWLPRAAPVRMVVGEPLSLPDLDDAADRKAARRAATELLTAKLRDFLAAQEHPAGGASRPDGGNDQPGNPSGNQ